MGTDPNLSTRQIGNLGRRQIGVCPHIRPHIRVHARSFAAIWVLLLAAADEHVAPRQLPASSPGKSQASLKTSSGKIDQSAPLSAPSGELLLRGTIGLAPGSQGEILAPSTGRILYATDPPKNIGEKVKKGEPLCVLEHHYNYHDYAHLYTERWPLQKEFLNARRKLVDATVAAERARYLYSISAVSLKNVQDAQARLKESEAEFEGAKKRLERHDAEIARSQLVRQPLLSPISGVIVAARYHQGQLVYEGDKIYTIMDLSKVWAKAEVFESDLSRVLKAKDARVVAVAFPQRVFRARFAKMGTRVQEPARTLDVFYEVENPGDQLKIGMLVTVSPVGAGPEKKFTAKHAKAANLPKF